MKRFVLYPGYVVSPQDGDRHYVTAYALAAMYEVDIQECVIIRGPEDLCGLDVSDLLELSPKDNWYAIVGPAERRQYPIKGSRADTN